MHPGDDKFSRLRQKAEAAMQRLQEQTDGGGVDLQNAIHELAVHQIELEIQNEELQQAQRRSEEARDSYARLYNLSPVGYLILDEQGLISRHNHTFAQMTGAPEHGVTGRPLADFMDGGSREIFLGRYRAFFKSPLGKAIDVRLLAASGAPLWVRLVGRKETAAPLIPSQEAGREHLLATLTDITERKLMEDALRERMKELNCLFAVSRVLHLDLSVEEACRRIVATLPAAMQFPEIATAVIDLGGICFSAGNVGESSPYALCAGIRGVSGSQGELRVSYTEHRDFLLPEEQQLVEGVAEALGSWLDRKAARDALRDSEERYRNLFQNASSGIVHLRPDGRFAQVNPAFAIMTGYRSPEEMIAAGDGAAAAIFAEPERHRELVGEAMTSGGWAGAEQVYRRRDGAPITVSISLRRVLGVDGSVSYLEGFVEDITERKSMDEAIRLNGSRVESLLKLSQMVGNTERDIISYALEEAIRLTNSAGGYLHFFNDDEQTIQLNSWSKEVLKTCKAASDHHYPLTSAGVWADSARLRRPVVHNDYQHLPGRKGYPSGHFTLLRHLGVPIFDGERIVGVTGVGNKEVPYTEDDVRQVQLFMNSMWAILKRQRMDLERERIIRELEEALSSVKLLSGMLPICASCKKIRNDEGYWQQVEVYIGDHSEAEFSHGICPECAWKLYPKQAEKLFGKDKAP